MFNRESGPLNPGSFPHLVNPRVQATYPPDLKLVPAGLSQVPSPDSDERSPLAIASPAPESITLPDLMFGIDAAGIVVEYFPSPHFETQWLPPNCVGLSLESALSEDLAAWVLHYSQQAIETATLQLEEYVLQQNQQWQHYEARFFPATSGGKVWVIVRDITARKEREATLRISELQHQQRSIELEKTLKQLREAQAQLVQAEKLSSLGQLVAGVAHEINNPVNFIHGNLEYVGEYVEELLSLLALYQAHYPNPAQEIVEASAELDLPFIQQDLPSAITSMRLGTRRICEIVKSLRTFSHKDEAEKKQTDIHASLDSTLVILGHRLKGCGTHADVKVIKDYGMLPEIECYGSQINQVLMNLMVNALDAMEEYAELPELRIQTRVYTIGDTTHGLCCGAQPIPTVSISIADNGAGIPAAIGSQLFDPFFTTKPVGKGTGLGLSICYNIIVEKHGGVLRYQSRPEGGTEFTILLPLYDGREMLCNHQLAGYYQPCMAQATACGAGMIPSGACPAIASDGSKPRE
jgi:signal transduction histidine kinase